MIDIRPYREADIGAIGQLIADTFGEFNLAFASPEQRALLLGPFRHARSQEKAHREAIADVITASVVLVAEDHGQIVGVLRGRMDRLQSLFVRGDHHRRGIGSRLVEHFEQECIRQGATEIRVASSLYAVPFYQRLGYKKTTGVRAGRCFDGTGFEWQPMKKTL